METKWKFKGIKRKKDVRKTKGKPKFTKLESPKTKTQKMKL